MPYLKRWSTGRLGNTWGLHPNTDHVNTRGLDKEGFPGVESYIDEDIVRSFDDSRPLLNLLSNDDQTNKVVDTSHRNLGISASLKNDYNDFVLTIDSEDVFTDPEDFAVESTVTPLRVGVGVAYGSKSGAASVGFKKLIGLKRDNGTTLWVDEHTWYYSSTPSLADDDTSYGGLYRPIYTDASESGFPSGFEAYEITITQLTTTGSVYTFPIYLSGDFIIPYSSSVTSITGTVIDFSANSEYPYYNHYDESSFQLSTSGVGILEIDETAEISKNLKRFEHFISGADFTADSGAFTAELTSEVFRANKSSNINRIENDTNFLRAITGVEFFNQTSRVYLHPHKSAIGLLTPIYDNRDFLGSQEYSFEVAFYESTESSEWEEIGIALMNAETASTAQFTSVVSAAGSSLSAQRCASNSLYGDYGYEILYTSAAINCYGRKTFTAVNEVYIRAYVNIGNDYKLAAAGAAEVLSLFSGASQLVSLSITAGGDGVADTWSYSKLGGATVALPTTPTLTKNRFHKIEIRFNNALATASIWIDGVANSVALSTALQANTAIVGPYTTSTTSNAGSRMYFDDIKIDTARVADYSDRYRVITLTSPETRGYQDLGLSIADPDVNLIIPPASDYGFDITVNNDASPLTVSVSINPLDSLREIAVKLQAGFDANDIYASARVFDTGGGSWDLRIYSKSSGDYSKISLATPTTGTDLIPALGLSWPISVAVDGTSDWHIFYASPMTLADHTAVRTGGVTDHNDFSTYTTTIGHQLYTSMVTAGFDEFVVGINNITTDEHLCELYIGSYGATQGYQELGMTTVSSALSSGLSAVTEYDFGLTIDGVSATYSVTTTTDVTFGGVVSALNNVLSGVATVSINGTDLRITSNSYGPYSNILTVNGVTNSLFGSGTIPAAAAHDAAVVGTGKVISVRPRRINSFAIHSDSVQERAVYSHSSATLYIAPDTDTDIRDYVDTEAAYNNRVVVGYPENRWSTYNDRVIDIDLSTHGGWATDATITKLFTLTIGAVNYLLVGNSAGQIFFYEDGNLYDEDITLTDFTIFTSVSLSVNLEPVNNFFVYDDATNGKKYLFILTNTYIYCSEDIASGIAAATVFTAINTSDPGTISNPISDTLFSKIRDAESWDATVGVSPAVINKYIIFVGDSAGSNWIYAPILYALYDDSAFTFTWFAENIYLKTQIDNISSIVKHNGWEDSSQDYQLFISNNANGPEIWSGGSQNSSTDIGGGASDQFNKFTWIESNHENGADPLSIDTEVSELNFVEVYDNRIFAGGDRLTNSTLGGFYSYGLQKVQDYFQRDADLSYVTPLADALYVTMYRDTIGDTDPAIVKISEEVDDGIAQVFSSVALTTVSNWATDSSFKVTLVGFDVASIDYSGEYIITFDGDQANLTDIVAAINGSPSILYPSGQGFKRGADVNNPGTYKDLSTVIRAREIWSWEYASGSYTRKYKIVIESIVPPGTEVTQTDCSITIEHPTTGTTVVGTGSNTMEIADGSIGEANLQLVEWMGAECYQVNRVNSGLLTFGVDDYINITPEMTSGYSILTGSVRVRTSANYEVGFSQGNGKIITASSLSGLSAGTYSFRVQFDARAASSVIDEVSITFATSTSTIQNLIDGINADLTGGTASLRTLGGTAEYCDIIITSSTTGDDSSVKILKSNSGTYLFGIDGLNLINNEPIQGSTLTATAGNQTLGFTWENSDYFVEYNHPSTSEARVYIPNGSTRIPAGATVYIDFWQKKKLTKIANKTGAPPANNIPAAGQWTYNIEEKKIVLGTQPKAIAPIDLIFIDTKIKKVLAKLDLSDTPPTNQEEMSNEFNATQPRNLSNSEIAVSRATAEISALHYGIEAMSSDSTTGDELVIDYSYYLPRVDVLVVRRDQDEYGDKVKIVKGIVNALSPFVEFNLNSQVDETPLYATYVSSQDYETNNIVELPWYKSHKIEEGKIYIDGDTQYFRPEAEFISDRGLSPVFKQVEVDKVIVDNNYKLVRVTDAVGIYHHRNRDTTYSNIDSSQAIYVSQSVGNNANTGESRSQSVETLAKALTLVTADRPYIIIEKSSNTIIETFSSFTIDFAFKVYIIAEYIATIAQITVESECYLQGLNVTTSLLLKDGHDVTAKYCKFQKIETDDTGTFVGGINLLIQNSVIVTKGLEVIDGGGSDLDITGLIDVRFDHIYISLDVQLLDFRPNSYDTTLSNHFVFDNITNYKSGTGNVIVTPNSVGLSIEINNSVLPGDSSTNFNSEANIYLDKCITYATLNSGTGSLIATNCQTATAGYIDTIEATGASESIARGYSSDSYAIDYIDRHEDAGAFCEERTKGIIKYNEQASGLRSLLHMRESRVEYRYDLLADKFSFFMKFKPAANYNTSPYVLFDSRYSGDYDADSSLFNKNATDFMQIVYDNKTYGNSYLYDDLSTPSTTCNKWCFKFIASNDEVTYVSVIGPYFTSANYYEYNNWHEIALSLFVKDTSNNKYSSADLSGYDDSRKQTIIITFFDGLTDRLFATKNLLYQDASGNELSASKWHIGDTLSNYFNIGGGWLSDWSSSAWTIWTEYNAHITVESFAISRDIIPANILKDLGTKEVIDLYASDYRIGRLDDKSSGIICHCDNPYPFSDNSLQPDDESIVVFRPYEGFNFNAISVENASTNLLSEGRITNGDWFDRSAPAEFVAATVTLWGAEAGLTGIYIVSSLYSSGTNLIVDLVSTVDASTTSVTVLSGVAVTDATMTTVGSYLVVAYIKTSDTFAYFKTINTANVVSAEFTINNSGATTYLYAHPGQASNNVIFSYKYGSLGYIKLMNLSGTTEFGPTSFTDATNLTYSAVVATDDKDGNGTYTVFWRETPSNALKYVMYDSTLATKIWPTNTLTTGEQPAEIKAEVFPGSGDIIASWKNLGGPTIRAAIINREGFATVAAKTIYATADANSYTKDFLMLENYRILFAAKQVATNTITYHIFNDDLTEISNSGYLRTSVVASNGKVFLSNVSGSNNYSLTTDITGGGNIILLDTGVPTRWFKDYSGSYDSSDPFETSVQDTDSLFGWAGYLKFNHAAVTGQGTLWQTATIGSADQHYISGYYFTRSGTWILGLAGGALSVAIEIEFKNESIDESLNYVHNTKGTDTVNFVEVLPLNNNRGFRFVVGFTTDAASDLTVSISSTDSDDDTLVDEFLVDNIKLESYEHPTSVDASSAGFIDYSYYLKRRGSAFFRLIPQFFYDTSYDHAIFSGSAIDSTGATYVTHVLYYDETDNKFKFSITDSAGTTETVESDAYGNASSVAQLTDLNEKQTIVCNWDVEEGFLEMFINGRRYYSTIVLTDFEPSTITIIGAEYDHTNPADCLFDLIRIGDDTLTEVEINTYSNKIDPFVRKSETDLGIVNVKGLSFEGIASGDLYSSTIYTEKSGDNWLLVIDKGSGFEDQVVIRSDGVNIVTFGATGVTIDGSLSVTNLIAETVTSVVSIGDHISLKYGFSGTPLPADDAYLEVVRGSSTNSEVRWDESQDAWVIHNGTDNVISIDTSIGTWKSDQTLSLVVNGTGYIAFSTGTSTNSGGGDGTQARSAGTERFRITQAESVFNEVADGGNDLRVESGGSTHMLFVDGGNDKVFIGRSSATSATGSLVVNNAITVQYSTNAQYGKIEFRNNAGTLAGYIGTGDGATYWEIVSSGSNYLKITSDVEMATGKFLRWSDDTTDTKLGYTSNATTQTFTGPLAYEGVYCNGNFVAYKVFNNVWNDYAEAFEFDKRVEPSPEAGYVYKMTKNGLVRSDTHADKAAIGIYSDTYGELMGAEGLYDPFTEKGYKIPIGLAGKVKVWIKEKIEIGDMMVSDEGGFATKATLSEMYPDLIIGKAIEESLDDKPKRIWILIK